MNPSSSAPGPVESIRNMVRRELSTLPDHSKSQLTDQAIAHFLRTREFRNARHIACYFPVKHELNLLPLIEACWQQKKTVYLPCLSPKPFLTLYFLPFSPNTRLAPNRFGIPEPDHSVIRRIPVQKLDIVITPLLAFSSNGIRLGTGGGYYDRTFAFQRHHRHIRRPRLWSIALELQHHPLIAREWDVPLHGIATETRIYRPSS